MGDAQFWGSPSVGVAADRACQASRDLRPGFVRRWRGKGGFGTCCPYPAQGQPKGSARGEGATGKRYHEHERVDQYEINIVLSLLAPLGMPVRATLLRTHILLHTYLFLQAAPPAPPSPQVSRDWALSDDVFAHRYQPAPGRSEGADAWKPLHALSMQLTPPSLPGPSRHDPSAQHQQQHQVPFLRRPAAAAPAYVEPWASSGYGAGGGSQVGACTDASRAHASMLACRCGARPNLPPYPAKLARTPLLMPLFNPPCVPSF
jgi:hypothetical protein